MKDKLYIIGNGFDLHHGLKTSYANFRDDFAKKSYTLLNSFREIYGDLPNNDLWWKDFENMLGVVNYEHLISTYNGEALGALKVKNLLKGKLPPLFGEWIKGIDKELNSLNIELMNDIEKDSWFFTFNYTLLLEKIYHIEDNRIWHIHGSINHIDDIIVGHDSDETKLFKSILAMKTENPDFQIRSDVLDVIMKAISNGAKRVKDIIYKNNYMFNKYSDIKHFVVMGFSFNDIDLPYIKKIVEVNKSILETDWTVYWHSPGEDTRIKNILKEIGIHENMILSIYW